MKANPGYKTSMQLILSKLQSLQPFIYYPNPGNIGDCIIAESTYQLFEKNNIEYTIYNEASLPESYNLVFGGGGGIVPYWGAIEKIKKILLNSKVNKCILLPQSIYQADDFIEKLDARFTVFCRENKTFNYVKSINPNVECILSHDMAFYLERPKFEDYQFNTPNKLIRIAIRLISRFFSLLQNRAEELRYYQRWNAGFREKLLNRQLNNVHSLNNNHRFSFNLREDMEKKFTLRPLASFDISLSWEGQFLDRKIVRLVSSCFFDALELCDIIITDRLHVGIVALHLNKTVLWLDNSYGKIFEIYMHSLRHNKNANFIKSIDEIPTEYTNFFISTNESQIDTKPANKLSLLTRILNFIKNT